tara:strand:- start:438 stop:2057 length:1620 start_codon:yes stop_codon:yes gene_type:complete
MNEIIDAVISISTNKQYERKVFSSFIYNKYSNNETTTRDNIIKFNLKRNLNDIKKKFIRLSLSRFTALNDQDLDEFTLNIYELFQLSEIINLKEEHLKYFNRQENFNHNRRYYINTIDEDHMTKVINYYTSNNTNNTVDSDRIKIESSRPSKMSIIKDDTLNLELLNNNKKVKNHIFKNDLINTEVNTSQLKKINEGYLFNSFVFLKQTVNGENFNSFAKKNGVRCGLLIEKYKLVNDEFVRSGAKFYTKKRSEDNLQNLPKIIEDEAIQYGKTYKYVISDVYLYAYPDEENRFILNYYLLCDNKTETEAIVCRENIAPPPPKNLNFKYNEEKRSLKITWEEPTNYQYDAKGFQILKRFTLDEPYTVIQQLEGHSSSDDYQFKEVIESNIITKTSGVKFEYHDKNYEPGRVTIYAIRTIDAHGFISDYSAQIAILYDPFEQKLIVDKVSSKGAKRDYPNQKVKRNSIFFKNNIDIIENVCTVLNPASVHLYITPEFGGFIKGNGQTEQIFGSDYQFTITKLNNMSSYKDKFKIENFNLS